MKFLISQGDRPEKIDGSLERKKFDDFEVLYSEDSVDVEVMDGKLFLFTGLITNEDGLKDEEEEFSDTDLIRRIWSEEESLKSLDGSYIALVIDDEGLHVFRDVFGSKPVYFTEKNDFFSISSHIRPLLEALPELRSVNETVARDYLKHGLVDHRRETFFENIERLRPREKLSFSGEIQIKEISYDLNNSSSLKSLLEENIEALKPSDSFYCPVSGGLDSTVVASESPDAENIHASFTQGTLDDRFIDSVRDEYGIDTLDVEISPEDIISEIEDTITVQEEPTVFPAFQAQSIMYSGMDEDSVVLSGTGADELFYGYQWFLPFYLADKMREKNLSGLLRTLIDFRSEIRFHHILKSVKTLFKGESKLLDIGSGGLVEGSAEYPKVSGVEDARDFHLNRFYFPHMLRCIEKQSDERDLEVRHTFLSRKILAYSESLAPEENYHNGLKKYPIRSSFKDDLPKKIYGRKNKTGFVWMTNRLFTPDVRKKFLETFRSDSFQNRDLIHSRKALRTLQNNNLFFGTAYRLYSYEKWMQEFID